MLYLNKFLARVKENPTILKSQDIILTLGLTATHIKELKKFALENEFIERQKNSYFLTQKGLNYLETNPTSSWATKNFTLRPEINVEYLKEEKTAAVLTKAIRLLAKNLLENQALKDFSLEHALSIDLKNCSELTYSIETAVLNGKRICLSSIYEEYLQKGITNSLISINILKILSENLDKIAIYEKAQFQLKMDALMFDRMMVCPQNFELQKTEMPDIYILKDISKVILHEKNNNILEITKGLYRIIKTLDKYTMNTQNLSKNSVRLRNTIINAKDPISLFKRDIPKVLAQTTIENCNIDFINSLKQSLDELKYCTKNLVKDIKIFILKNFHAKNKEELADRFLAIKEYIGEQELKVLLNTVIETNVDEELWTCRIATFINSHRVPKDWSDEDFANFKIKTKELALKFFILESIAGNNDSFTSEKYKHFINEYLKLSKPEQTVFLRKIVNI